MSLEKGPDFSIYNEYHVDQLCASPYLVRTDKINVCLLCGSTICWDVAMWCGRKINRSIPSQLIFLFFKFLYDIDNYSPEKSSLV
jgi:hypothetical protein